MFTAAIVRQAVLAKKGAFSDRVRPTRASEAMPEAIAVAPFTVVIKPYIGLIGKRDWSKPRR